MLSAKRNNATNANINMNALYAKEAFKNVYKGVYTEGERKNEECVSKIFINNDVNADLFFHNEMEIVKKAMAIIENFNKQVTLVDKKIYLNEPGIWTFTAGHLIGQKNLIETMIQNFEKFNSNSAWVATGAVFQRYRTN
jgi:hypothetical protein